MTLGPTPSDRAARARADLAAGLPVILTHGTTGALVLAAETAPDTRLAALISPDTTLALTHHRAATLKARAYDGDLARLLLPPDITPPAIRALAAPETDLRTPLAGPHLTARDGDATLHRAALHLAKSARLLPAVLVRPVSDARATAGRHDLTCLPAELPDPPHVAQVVSARVPLASAANTRLHLFRAGPDEHVAIEIGRPDRAAPVLTRLHSACFTGDLLGSLKCDCGPQLHAALDAMGARGAGLILYLNQEGRGIGLANKLRAYALQDQGFDTVEANHRLGFEDDERDFRLGAEMLQALGVRQVRLMTNNPRKLERLAACGLEVTERVPLHVGETAENLGYLATKAEKSGHLR